MSVTTFGARPCFFSTWAARDYAELRLSEHYSDFRKLVDMADKMIKGEDISSGEQEFFADCRKRDALFGDIDIEWFARVEYPI